jgi:NADPH:quinone reductase-like Zn-dependent oxidoreductase
MGHEFTGTVSEIGNDIKTVKVGDTVVVPFTVSWYVPLSFEFLGYVMSHDIHQKHLQYHENHGI